MCVFVMDICYCGYAWEEMSYINIYVRVKPWGAGSLATKLPHTEICGVAEIDPLRHIPKVKVNGHWLSWIYNDCRAETITKEEFETDLEFGLWPKLKVKYCPKFLWWLRTRYCYLQEKWDRLFWWLA